MASGGEFLRVKPGDIIETDFYDCHRSGHSAVFMVTRDGKAYPGEIVWGVLFPLGDAAVTISTRKCYTKLLYSPEEV